MGDYDGWITIGTTLDTKQLDRDLKVEQRKLEQAEKEFEKLTQKKAKINLDLKDYYAELQEAKKNFDEFKSGDLEFDNRQYKESVDAINNKYREQLKALKDINLALNQNIIKQGMIRDNISGINLRLGNVGVTSYLKDIGKHLTATIKKVGKWALAVFGLRTAYTAIRQAMSTLSQYDEQLKTDLQYIRFAIATAFEPIIKKLVEWVYKLLGFVNAISVALFNYNLFTNATVDNFKKLNSQANSLKKTLAGFDEMNVIGGTNSILPGVDLSKSADKINEQTDSWINKFKKKIDELMRWVGKTISNPEVFNTSAGNWSKFMKGIGETVLGLGMSFDGLGKQVEGVWRTIKGIFTGNIEEIAGGIDEFMEGLTETLYKGIPLIFKGLGDIVLGTLDALIITPLEQLFSNTGKWVREHIINPIKEEINKLPNWIKIPVKGIVNTIIFLINSLINGLNNFSRPFSLTLWGIGKIFGKNWSIGDLQIPKIPYVRKGAVINQPNRGVPVGSAMAGESGREGVIPLTDSQQMALLGEEIGRNVIVNLTNITQMNGRQINRELKRINMQDAFAGNR